MEKFDYRKDRQEIINSFKSRKLETALTYAGGVAIIFGLGVIGRLWGVI